MIRVQSLQKTYQQNKNSIEVFSNLDFQLETGEFMALMGESGAGKSTLLQILGCLDRPDQGEYLLDGQDMALLNEEKLNQIRNRDIGFVFQTSFFIDYLDLVDNVALPGFYARQLTHQERRERAAELLTSVGLGQRLNHLPAELSGGERQRAAIARALFNQPKLILADEPTGNLDKENTLSVINTLKQFNAEGLSILLVTHDAAVADMADRLFVLKKNQLSQEPALSRTTP